jgi:hypothetical protein
MTVLVVQFNPCVYLILRWKAMSTHETPMTRWYWQQVKGTLIEEYVAVQGGLTCGRRVLLTGTLKT